MSIGLTTVVQKLPSSIRNAGGSAYSVDGKYPKLSLDFINNYYRAEGLNKFSDVVTHSRSGNATMVDSDGLLKWAPHNLQTDSQDFSGASWSTTNTTVTANAANAPDGTATADKVEQTASGDWRIASLNSVVDADYTYGVFLKTVSGTGSIGIRIYDGASFSDTLCSVTEEWQLFTVSSSGTTQNIYIDSRVSGSTLTEVYAWGAHLYRSDLGGMADNPDRGDSYVPTTSAAVYLPRRGHHVYNGSAWVNEGLLHESEARTNLITYSEDFTDASWTANNVSVTKKTGITAPDGTENVYHLQEDATDNQHQLNSGVTAGTQVFSVYAKGDGSGRYLKLYGYGLGAASEAAIFDVDNGILYEPPTSTYFLSASIQDAGNGWYRCSLRADTDGGTGNPTFALVDATDSRGIETHTGDGTSGVYLFGAQLEASSGQVSSYIPTAGSTVTRAAETLTIPSANLPWPTPQVIGDELVTNGTFDTDSDWTKEAGWTISGGEASHGTVASSRIYQNIAVEVGKVYLATLDITAINNTGWGIGLQYDGTAIDVFVNDGSTIGSMAGIFVATDTIATIAVQQGSGGRVSIDNVSVREINPLSVSIQMDGRITYADEGVVATSTFYRWRPSDSNYIETRIETDVGSGEVIFVQRASSVSDVVSSSVSYLAPDILVPFNIASRHGSTFINGAVDGVALTADTTPTALPDLSATDLTLGYDFMGTIKTFRIWDKDLGDTGIEEATAPSLEPSLELVFDGSESSFVVLDWEN